MLEFVADKKDVGDLQMVATELEEREDEMATLKAQVEQLEKRLQVLSRGHVQFVSDTSKLRLSQSVEMKKAIKELTEHLDKSDLPFSRKHHQTIFYLVKIIY